jgi:hypothetical protein
MPGRSRVKGLYSERAEVSGMSGAEAWILLVNTDDKRDVRAKRSKSCFMVERVMVKRRSIYINSGGYASCVHVFSILI